MHFEMPHHTLDDLSELWDVPLHDLSGEELILLCGSVPVAPSSRRPSLSQIEARKPKGKEAFFHLKHRKRNK